MGAKQTHNPAAEPRRLGLRNGRNHGREPNPPTLDAEAQIARRSPCASDRTLSRLGSTYARGGAIRTRRPDGSQPDPERPDPADADPRGVALGTKLGELRRLLR